MVNVLDYEDEMQTIRYGFQIWVKGVVDKQFHFCVDTKREKDNWISRIKKVMNGEP